MLVDARQFGAFIKELREELGLSIHDLSSISGISVSYLSRVERGLRDIPNPNYLRKLASGLNMEYEKLLQAAGFLDSDDAIVKLGTPPKTPVQDLKKILAQQEIMFDGVPLTDEDRRRVEDILTGLFWEAKQMNKRKPKSRRDN